MRDECQLEVQSSAERLPAPGHIKIPFSRSTVGWGHDASMIILFQENIVLELKDYIQRIPVLDTFFDPSDFAVKRQGMISACETWAMVRWSAGDESIEFETEVSR